MIFIGLFLSIALLILSEAGLIVLSTFYIWLPLLVTVCIVILQVIIIFSIALLFNNGKVYYKKGKFQL